MCFFVFIELHSNKIQIGDCTALCSTISSVARAVATTADEKVRATKELVLQFDGNLHEIIKTNC